ncbi:MAG: NAD(P)H-dependent oxidoreductase subunit E [Acidimicrobiia bacterium]
MDLVFRDIEPTAAERAAVDGVVGLPGDADASGEGRLRVVRGGEALRARRHLLLPALAAVQGAVGWISEGALDYLCRALGVPPAEAYGVASFYALLTTERTATRVAHVCDDVGCGGFGAAELIDDLEARLGPAAQGPERTWKRSPCLGQCDRAPAAFLQIAEGDDVVLTRTTGEAVEAALEDPALLDSDPLAPPRAGDRDLRLLRRVGIVDPASLDDYRRSGGYLSLPRAMEIGPAGVLDELEASGLRGRGGAAFPTAVKWKAVAEGDDPHRYVICNADESEPGTFKDRALMEGDPFAIVEAITIAGITVGAREGYIYVRGEYPVAQRRLLAAVDAAREARLLGPSLLGSALEFDIEVRSGAGAYICGEETALMNSIEGYRGEPRNKPPFPTQQGLFGKPTVVNNVETLVNVLDIVGNGGQAFATIGTAETTGTRLFCLSGAVERPGVYEVESGMTLGALIDLAGGVRYGADLRAVLLGGAAGSFVGPDALDMPLTFEAARSRGLSLGSGVVMVFDDEVDLRDVLRRIAAFFRDESCGQCVPCRIGTVRQEELLSRHLASGMPLDTGLLGDIAQVMRDASICGLGHTASSAIESAISLGLVDAT